MSSQYKLSETEGGSLTDLDARGRVSGQESPIQAQRDGGRESYTSRQTMNRIGDKSSQYKFSKTTNRPGEEQELSAKGPAEVPGK